ncbi:hypothetical protein CLV59_110152 [Chitinophaga dinghuensis]|uniref:WD40 repeat protein n=2 Tax=Chitinophaga dinghuensis TaxID=1539050 RepID=A0A327VMW7_9BACT|nr:hypothetical protein CLV59_110152 [Chitinophaga dinghuensis]
MGSFALMLFSASILLFQMSCKKSADAEPGPGTGNGNVPVATTTTLGGVIVGSGLNVTAAGVLSVNAGNSGATQLNKVVFTKYISGSGSEIWLMNYDGSGQTKVNVALSANQKIGDDARLSPDGKKLFFIVATTGLSNNKEDIYSCDIDGKNLVKLYDMPVSGGHTYLSGAY